MNFLFEITRINIHHNRGAFIIARHLGDNHNIVIPDGSILGELPIFLYKPMHPFTNQKNEILAEVFVFCPMRMEDLFFKGFKEGDRLELVV